MLSFVYNSLVFSAFLLSHPQKGELCVRLPLLPHPHSRGGAASEQIIGKEPHGRGKPR